jgi:hypothetical protein
MSIQLLARLFYPPQIYDFPGKEEFLRRGEELARREREYEIEFARESIKIVCQWPQCSNTITKAATYHNIQSITFCPQDWIRFYALRDNLKLLFPDIEKHIKNAADDYRLKEIMGEEISKNNLDVSIMFNRFM